MKTKSIFWILLFSFFGFSMLGGIIHIIQYYPNQKDVKVSVDSISGMLIQVGAIIEGIFVGFILFTPRGKKEFTKSDFIKPKGEINP